MYDVKKESLWDMIFTWVLGSHTQREESETAVTTLLSSQTQFTIVTCQEQEIT